MHNIIKETVLFWNLNKKVRKDIIIAGSPERCEFILWG